MQLRALFLATVLASVPLRALAADPTPVARASAAGAREAVAVMSPIAGHEASGLVRFVQTTAGVKVVAEIDGLEPGQRYALHIHEWGDISGPDGKRTGGHYNPEGHDHGLPGRHQRHAGDLGNLAADARGEAHYELTVANVTLGGPENPILGRGVVIHARADDGSQPTGNAGPRISQGVIGLVR